MADRPTRRHDRHEGDGPRKGEPASRPRGLARGVRIVFEDPDILVVDKPCGMLSAYVGKPRGEGYEGDDLFSLVKRHVRSQAKGRTRQRQPVYVVHRLDREVSGLMVFAKSDRAMHWLKEDLRARRVQRHYHAVVEGELPITGAGSSGTIQSYLRENEKGVVESVPAPATTSRREGESSDVKVAVTHWRCVLAGRGHSLLQIRLETGRKNQIRVHMKEMGHPICGDRRYGSSEDPAGRVCLHAGEISFAHGFTGQSIRLKSPIPREFFRIVGAGRDDVSAVEGKEPERVVQPAPVARESGWDHVASWYDNLIEEGKSDHFERVIIPGALRLTGPREGQRILDVACGQGAFCRVLAGQGARVTGIDISPRLIEAARRGAGRDGDRSRFEVVDARELEHAVLSGGAFDCVTCLMALMNIEPLAPVFHGIRSKLAPGGKFVCVILHPAFRAPGQTSWAWDAPARTAERPGSARPRQGRPDRGKLASEKDRQYRRVDGYLSPAEHKIVMNPGAASSGAEAITTTTYHRPLQTYMRLLADAGFVLEALEEWPSARQSQPGPRAAEENRARREIPMFLALRAVHRGNP
ncbi:MAG: pseudouridine synthase [Phycisphaerales bacterium]|nr:methyltransferase domain-containing protein [Planctomycetota bacterium]